MRLQERCLCRYTNHTSGLCLVLLVCQNIDTLHIVGDLLQTGDMTVTVKSLDYFKPVYWNVISLDCFNTVYSVVISLDYLNPVYWNVISLDYLNPVYWNVISLDYFTSWQPVRVVFIMPCWFFYHSKYSSTASMLIVLTVKMYSVGWSSSYLFTQVNHWETFNNSWTCKSLVIFVNDNCCYTCNIYYYYLKVKFWLCVCMKYEKGAVLIY